jgi:hypothetical protein
MGFPGLGPFHSSEIDFLNLLYAAYIRYGHTVPTSCPGNIFVIEAISYMTLYNNNIWFYK